MPFNINLIKWIIQNVGRRITLALAQIVLAAAGLYTDTGTEIVQVAYLVSASVSASLLGLSVAWTDRWGKAPTSHVEPNPDAIERE